MFREREGGRQKAGIKLSHPKPIHLVFLLVLALTSLVPGCALRNKSPRSPEPVTSTKPPIAQHCPDRVQRASTGGFVGTVLGTVAAGLIGGPLVGGIYKAAGYVIGFASADMCRKGGSPLETNGSLKTDQSSTSPAPSPSIGEEHL